MLQVMDISTSCEDHFEFEGVSAHVQQHTTPLYVLAAILLSQTGSPTTVLSQGSTLQTG